MALCEPDSSVLGRRPGGHHADEVTEAVTLALHSDRRQPAKCSPCGLAAFGQDYGLIVETAPGAGTKVIVRLPKFAPG